MSPNMYRPRDHGVMSPPARVSRASHRVNARAVSVSDRSSGANVVTRLSPDLDEAFAALCSERKMTRAALMRELIKLALEAQKKPPDLAARGDPS